MITLREITESNLEQVLSLDVFEHQNNYVSTTAYSLAQAWLYHDTAFPFAIYSDELLIGFVMLGYYKVKKQYTLWKFLIDKRYQNKGYGKQALNLALKYLIDIFNVNEIYTGVAFGNTIALHLYSSLGFVKTGEFDDYQLEMRLDITDKTKYL